MEAKRTCVGKKTGKEKRGSSFSWSRLTLEMNPVKWIFLVYSSFGLWACARFDWTLKFYFVSHPGSKLSHTHFFPLEGRALCRTNALSAKKKVCSRLREHRVDWNVVRSTCYQVFLFVGVLFFFFFFFALGTSSWLHKKKHFPELYMGW